MSTEQRLNTPPPPGLTEEPAKPKIELSLAQVLGGALAAMTAAYLGSRLSVAGTVVGAAVASIVAAVAGSVYTASLRTTQERVRTVFQGRTAGSDLPTTVETTGARDPRTSTDAPAQPSAPGTTGTARPTRVPWKTVLMSALAAFLLAAVALTGLEVATGEALSGGEGTTVTQVTEPRTTAPEDDSTPSAAPSSASPSATGSESPTAAPTPSASSSPGPTTEPTPVAPTTSASPAPTTSASPAPTTSTAVPSAPSTADPTPGGGG